MPNAFASRSAAVLAAALAFAAAGCSNEEPAAPKGGAMAPAKPEMGKPEMGKSEMGKPEMSKPEMGKMEMGKPEMGKMETGKMETGKMAPAPK